MSLSLSCTAPQAKASVSSRMTVEAQGKALPSERTVEADGSAVKGQGKAVKGNGKAVEGGKTSKNGIKSYQAVHPVHRLLCNAAGNYVAFHSCRVANDAV